MKSRLCVVVFALILAPVTVFAQTDERGWFTGQSLNGRFWRDSESSMKVGYVMGLQEGVGLSWASVENAEIPLEYLRTLIGRFTNEELIQLLDAFYSDTANIRIPVAEAYTYAVEKASGESPAFLERKLTTLRREAAKP